MITGWEIYLFTRLNGIIIVCNIVFVISFLAVVVGLIIIFATAGDTHRGDEHKLGLRLKNAALIPMIISLCGLIFIPTSNQAAAIYVVPKLSNNEIAQKLPNEIHEAFKIWLNDFTSNVNNHKKVKK